MLWRVVILAHIGQTPTLCLQLPWPMAAGISQGSLKSLVIPSPLGQSRAKWLRTELSHLIRHFASTLPAPCARTDAFRIEEAAGLANDLRGLYHSAGLGLPDFPVENLPSATRCLTFARPETT